MKIGKLKKLFNSYGLTKPEGSKVEIVVYQKNGKNIVYSDIPDFYLDQSIDDLEISSEYGLILLTKSKRIDIHTK